MTESRHSVAVTLSDWIEHGFTSAPTQYRLHGRRFIRHYPTSVMNLIWFMNEKLFIVLNSKEYTIGPHPHTSRYSQKGYP